MRFKVGEKVRVRKDLNMSLTYYMLDENGNKIIGDHNSVMNDMMKFRGKIVTIASANKQYRLKDVEFWSWTDEMLEKIEKKPKVRPLRKRVKSVKEINNDIQQLQEQIKQLEKYKENRFNERTLVLEVLEDTNLNLNFEIFDEDINENMFTKTRKSFMSVYRHKNKIEVNISTPTMSGIGIARCHKNDEFNYRSGIALALTRANVDMFLKMEGNLLQQI